MKSKIAIIIVTYNGSKWIDKCLASVFKSTYENYAVIVVDNASEDNSADIARDFKDSYGRGVHLIELKENTGFVGGNNVGIKYAMERGYDAVVLLNQDTEVEPNWLNHLVAVARPNDIGIVQAMLVLGNERHLTNNAGNAMHYLGFGFVKHYREDVNQWLNRVEPLEIGYASGAGMFIKREVLEQAGALDKKFFMYHEDLDLCWRARMAGFKIMLAPKAVVYHYYEFNRNKKMFYWTERNRWAVLLQNYEFSTLLMLGPILFLIELMMILYSTASGWLNFKLQSYGWIVSHLGAILSKRWQVQKMRKVSDKEIMPYMDARLEFSEVSNPLLRHIVSPMLEWYFKLVR